MPVPPAPLRSRWFARAVPAALATAALLLVTTGHSDAPRGSIDLERTRSIAYAHPAISSPFTGVTLYADNGSAAQAAAKETDPTRRRDFTSIAQTPQAVWFGSWNPTSSLATTVAKTVDAAASRGEMPVLVAYAIPQRDCGGMSAGGVDGPEAYRAWVDALSAGIGAHQVAIVIEPDALAQMGCLSRADQDARFQMLTYATRALNANAKVATYLDAGHAGWVPAATMADRLMRADVVGARGFSLNVSNLGSTSDEVAYGRAVSSRIGWKKFVVDTGRNGLGAASGPDAWCNPAGRALGARPLTAVSDDLVDALLWIKRPGESDGDCGRGEPAAGTWWGDYAAGLAARAGR